MASKDSLSDGLSDYLDYFFQPIVSSLSAYIKDTGHILEILRNNTWQEGDSWVLLDVSSIYTSILHQIDLLALQYFLEKDNKLNSSQAAFLVEEDNFLLHPDYLILQDTFYLQIMGTAMGANFATIMPTSSQATGRSNSFGTTTPLSGSWCFLAAI